MSFITVRSPGIFFSCFSYGVQSTFWGGPFVSSFSFFFTLWIHGCKAMVSGQILLSQIESVWQAQKLGGTPSTSGRIKNHTNQTILNGLHWYFFKNLVLKSMLPCPRDTLTFPWRMPWRLKWKRTSCFEINSQTLRCGVLNVALPQGYIDLKTPPKKKSIYLVQARLNWYPLPYGFWGSSWLRIQIPDPCKSQCSPSQRIHRNFWIST